MKVKVFNKPRDDQGYSIGADVAMGLALGDKSAAVVLDRDMNMCAVWVGSLAPDLFGEFLCRLGRYYNNALLIPEVNNMGILTLDRIKSRNYPNVYTREVEEIRGEELKKQIGWVTTHKTKLKMLNEFVAAFRDKDLIIKDDSVLKEMAELYLEDDGNVSINGKDLVAATCLAIQGLTQVVIDGEFKAKVPGQVNGKDRTRMSIEDKIKFLKTRR